MADLQRYFEQFHNTVRVDFDSKKLLIEKRDIVLEKVEKHLKDNGRPGFDRLLQGSYKMKTGVMPLGDEEFDIDVGLVFSFEDLPDASEPRQWVLDAIKNHTDKVKAKTPCVRVHYKDSPPYHLDLVVYGKCRGVMKLATKRGWVGADPEGLLEFVERAHTGYRGTEGSTGIDQFRRVVRYLKRWGDVRLPGDAKHKPTGLAFTLLATQSLRRTVTIDGTPDDALALQELANQARYWTRISAKKPTPEYEDLFGRLNVDQMEVLKRDFGTLADTLEKARKEVDPHEACKLLVPLLGDDFPVPPEGSGGKKTSAPAIVSSSASA